MQITYFVVSDIQNNKPQIQEKKITIEEFQTKFHPDQMKKQNKACFLDVVLEDASENYDQNKEAQDLAKILEIEPEEFDDILSDQRPRCENLGWIFIIFKAVMVHPSDPTDKKEYQISLKIFDNMVISIHRNEPLSLEKLFKAFRRYPSDLIDGGSTYLFSRYLDLLIDPAYVLLNQWNKIADDLEKTVIKLKESNSKILDDVVNIRYGLFDVIKIMQANSEVVTSLPNQKASFILKDYIPEELGDHVRHVIDEAEVLRSFMSDLMNMYYSAESSQLNNTLARFTFATSLLLLPSLIAGIFGMNNPGFPSISFIWALIIMLLANIVLFFVFKRRKYV